MRNNSKILREVIKETKPSESEISEINEVAYKFIKILESCLGKHRISADVFIGGSIAKNTIIKKRRYDIDIFVRFAYNKYKENEKQLGDILEKPSLEGFKKFKEFRDNSRLKFERVHGSRDYFNIYFHNKKLGMDLIIELVPTLEIKKPQDALNITDLSFFHVRYVVNELKKKRLTNDVILAKAFCYANKCYGAESYIKGFSGYAIELLVLHYGGFEKFIKKASLWKAKVIIDPAKKYKKENEIMTNLNEAKLQSPVVIVDPTYSLRNVCAALSDETFARFVEACRQFVKKPRKGLFEEQRTNKKDLIKDAKRRNAKVGLLEITTKKDKEDIAYSKIIKFSDFIASQMKRHNFSILRKEIEFLGFKNGDYGAVLYFIYKKPLEYEVVEGPPLSLKEHAERFKMKYKKCSVKKGRLYSKAKMRIHDIKGLVEYLKKGNEIKDMQISGITLLK